MHFSLIFIVLFIFSFDSLALNKRITCEDQSKDYETVNVTYQSADDIYFCLGYLHGKYRGWQLDFLRKAGRGLASETFGYTFLAEDSTMQILNLEQISDSFFNALKKEDTKNLQIYSNGINAALKNEKPSREFLALDYLPEMWKPKDSFLVFLYILINQKQSLKSVLKANGNFVEDNIIPGRYELLPRNFSFKIIPQTPFGTSILGFNLFTSLNTPMLWFLSTFIKNNESIFGVSIPGIPIFWTGINNQLSWLIYPKNENIREISEVDQKILPDKFQKLLWFRFKYFLFPYWPLNKWQFPDNSVGIKIKKNDDLKFFKFKISNENKFLNYLLSFINSNFFLNRKDNEISSAFSGSGNYYDSLLISKNTSTKLSPNNSIFIKTSANKKSNFFLSPHNDLFFQSEQGKLIRDRIDELKNEKYSATLDFAKSVLCDNKQMDAQYNASSLIKLISKFPKTVETQTILKLLSSWDFLHTDDCKVCVFYEIYLSLLEKNLTIQPLQLSTLLNEPDDVQLDPFYTLFLIAYRESNNTTLGKKTNVFFDHVGDFSIFNSSPSWKDLYYPNPAHGGETSINMFLKNWSFKNRIFETYIGPSLRGIFEFTPHNNFKIHLSVSGKNINYQHPPISDDKTWLNWSKCIFYENSISW